MLLTKALILAAFLSVGFHWKADKDGYHVHRVYLGTYNELIGDYYQPNIRDPFTARCDEGDPKEFSTEIEAKSFVESCQAQ